MRCLGRNTTTPQHYIMYLYTGRKWLDIEWIFGERAAKWSCADSLDGLSTSQSQGMRCRPNYPWSIIHKVSACDFGKVTFVFSWTGVYTRGYRPSTPKCDRKAFSLIHHEFRQGFQNLTENCRSIHLVLANREQTCAGCCGARKHVFIMPTKTSSLPAKRVGGSPSTPNYLNYSRIMFPVVFKMNRGLRSSITGAPPDSPSASEVYIRFWLLGSSWITCGISFMCDAKKLLENSIRKKHSNSWLSGSRTTRSITKLYTFM